MFDSLKGKLKNVFKKSRPEPVKEDDIAPPEIADAVVTEELETLSEAPRENVSEQKLSRKEAAKLIKKEKAAEKVKDRGDAELVGDSGKKIKEGSLDDILWDLEVALMEADVAFPVVEEIKNGVRESLIGKKYARGHTLDEVVELSVKESISEILKLNEFDFDSWFSAAKRPTVIMFVGINGTGKTTSIAKIANRIIKQGKTVVLAASDTFRAGAIEQLTIHSERLGCKIVKHSSDADPAAVAFDAVEHATARRKDAVLVDTAGRMQTNNNLMDEMKKIKRVAKPDLVVFVGDSLAGNDAVEQARAFDAAVGIDAIMLTKIDADSKGGAALSIAHTIGKPIAFVANGQEYDQIIKFSSKWMMDRLFED
ncbi:MAG: signal recognition particle-docking protein FtsY [Methanomassiliicoccaceae archaeon]|nr:signal recognition particle-docking protein FtsY [Methanomassiliicoccaceae archaeon]